jgi:hypothetical protein
LGVGVEHRDASEGVEQLQAGTDVRRDFTVLFGHATQNGELSGPAPMAMMSSSKTATSASQAGSPP